MGAEIASQPKVLAALLENCGQISAAAKRISAAAPRFVLIAARGTSDHAALYAKYLVETELQLPAGLASPSSFTLFGAQPNLMDVLFLAVSQSGQSPDLVESMQAARRCGALTVAITNNSDSALARAAEISVDIQAGAEHAVAATKTYTAELLALYLLVVGKPSDTIGERLVRAATQTLALNDAGPVHQATLELRYTDRIVLTGRGYSYPTAREGALKLMETCYLAAQAFSAADLLHGPMAMVDSSVPVAALTGTGHAAPTMVPVIDRLRSVGAQVLTVGPGGQLPVACEDLPEQLLPIVEIMPLQLLAMQLAVARGGNPDTPRGLSKITETR